MKQTIKLLSALFLVPWLFINLQIQPVKAATCNQTQFIADVTVPDGTTFAPNTAFKKTWRIKNIGTCTWNTSNVSLIFDGGNKMGAPDSLPLPVSVQPGQMPVQVPPGNSVDLSVDMVAPAQPGHYFGYWKFKSSTGETFGIGYNANRSFWVEINVPSSSNAGYDFTANASSAAWSSGAGTLPFPGGYESPYGFGMKQEVPYLENGMTAYQPGLLFVPNSMMNGFIQASYPAIRIQSGDRFQASIGCEYGATSCYVSYGLFYQIGSGPVRTFWTFREKYEGLTYNVNLDLSSLANQDVKFILTVSAYGSPYGDRAVWVNPIISRVSAPPPPAANLPDLRISNVYLGMQGIPGNPTGCIANYGPFEIRVTVLNQGLSPAYSVPVVEQVSNTQLTIGQLNPGQSMELYFPAGGSSYSFAIDPQNTIPETDKNNNLTSYTPITPTPPVLCTPPPTYTPTPAPQANAILTWQSNDTPCKTASYWQNQMSYGFCQPVGAPLTLVNTQLPDYVSRISIWSKAYAPFTAQTRAGTVTFNGYGYVNATPAEQRMIAEWAARMYTDVPAGRSSAGDGVVISSHYNTDNSCYDTAIYRDGHYIVSSCLNTYTYPNPNGYLDANQLLYFYRWLDLYQSYQETTPEGSVNFIGNGPQIAELAQEVSIETMSLVIESQAKNEVFTSGGGMPIPVFAAQWVVSQQLGVPLEQVVVRNIQSATFPDACLGVQERICEPGPIPGYIVQLVAQGMLYEYHTDSVGYDIRPYGGPQPIPQGGG